jgi:poly-gamma-glutamate synthesis protein (capsule biosynthesis protein)
MRVRILLFTDYTINSVVAASLPPASLSHCDRTESQIAMPSNPLPQKAMVLAGAALILIGSVLAIWAVSSISSVFASTPNEPLTYSQPEGAAQPGSAAETTAPSLVSNPARAEAARVLPQSTPITVLRAEESAVAQPTSDPRPIGMTVAVPQAVPVGFLRDLAAVTLPDGKSVKVSTNASEGPLLLDWTSLNGDGVYTVTFAAATRFDTIFPETTWADVQSAWSGDVTTYTAVSVLANTLPALEQVLGPKGPTVETQAVVSDVVAAAWVDEESTLALLPFDQLDPELVVLTIDGQTPIENANHFTPTAYPFTAVLYAHDRASSNKERSQVQGLLAALPAGNRDPAKLTVLTMTGVTAMVRMMADEMDRRGAEWPAEYVGPELASADITHISNEVPFVDNCPTDLREDNFNFCTKKEYFETLRLSGVDIIGLTGNHQNDFGRLAALDSLKFYEEHDLPVYGGGRNVEEAYKPLYVQHNGNRLAFIGANSYGPEMAWADSDYPGSAKFDVNIMSATIRNIKEKNLADLVLVELQYQESYNTEPLFEQRNDFNALSRAGADIVTGVQSHVPQGIEFTDDRMILYGLGNLYFDQMWSQATRENLIYKHTFYNGRHISTQILTTLLYDFGQPRFMTADERARLLTRVFGASYWER